MAVAVAAIINPRGEVLISRRSDHVHQGGLWEFPGGKVEAGETVIEALERELHEELGIRCTRSRPLIRLRHDYPERSVVLDVRRVEAFDGVPAGREGQPLRWVAVGDLQANEFPAANRAIVHALQLPERCLVTPSPVEPASFLAQLDQAVAAGAGLVQLRAPEWDPSALAELAVEALKVCRRRGARLLFNGPPALARDCGADGVHLNSDRLMALRGRPLDASRWVSASCHDEHQVRHACAIDVDFLVIAPVARTASHPGAPVLGWEGFERLAALADRPVYALGGLDAGNLAEAWRRGAQGIAAIRGLWAGSGA